MAIVGCSEWYDVNFVEVDRFDSSGGDGKKGCGRVTYPLPTAPVEAVKF